MLVWLASLDNSFSDSPVPASSDASFRRYFRVTDAAEDTSYIVMDAPPAQEDSRPFIVVADYLQAMGLNCPDVLSADLNAGFLLMTDLGSVQYLHELEKNPDTADALYADALDTLLTMQTTGTAWQSRLPSYDETVLRREAILFAEWLCGKHLKIEFSAAERSAWESIGNRLIANALNQAQVFAHRDYHSRNLMFRTEKNPGILDFQDAVAGPFTYDLVSLLKDCYVKWPPDRVTDWALSYFSRLPHSIRGPIDEEQFLVSFDLMGVQRHLKAAGIFARLLMRDGKPGYMNDVPRTLGYIVEVAERHPGFEFLAELITGRILPALGEPDQ